MSMTPEERKVLKFIREIERDIDKMFKQPSKAEIARNKKLETEIEDLNKHLAKTIASNEKQITKQLAVIDKALKKYPENKKLRKQRKLFEDMKTRNAAR